MNIMTNLPGSLGSGDNVMQHDDSTYVSVPSNMASYRGNEPDQEGSTNKQSKVLSPKYGPKVISSGGGILPEKGP